MSKLLAVFGATGQQGNSVIAHVLADPKLSKEYHIRAITRDATSAKAKQLAEKGVQVVQADMQDPLSLAPALKDVHTAFIMTAPYFGPDAYNVEYNVIVSTADAAVAQGTSYLIFSSLPSITAISGGKYTRAVPFDAKAAAEAYIRTLPVKSSFVALGSFMQNFGSAFVKPRRSVDGTWEFGLPIDGATLFPLVDAAGDTGKFVGAILAEPEKYAGKTLCAATKEYSLEEIARIMGEAIGEKMVYRELGVEEFHSRNEGMPVDIFMDVLRSYREFEYFGQGQTKKVKWAAENARGRLSTFEEFLETNPLKLE